MMNRQQAPGLSQQPGQFRPQLPSSRQMMSNINPSSMSRAAGVGNGRMTATPGSTTSSWGYSQTETSRPSSTNPYTSSSLSFDRPSAGSPWGSQQPTSLDPSDFPALGSGSSNVHHGPPSSQSYASTAGTGQQQRLQQQIFARQGPTTDDSGYNLSSGPFSQDEFPALGGINEAPPQQQRQGGLPGHLPGTAGGQANGVYDLRQQVGQQLMTPPPNLQGTQSLQQAQEHRASMLEALQSGQRPAPRQPVLGGSAAMKDPRQGFPTDDQKLSVDPSAISNSIGLSSEEINAAADAAQSMPPNLNQTEFQTQDVDPSKREDSDADVWGIKGLLGIIKIEDSDKSKLALGVDLTSLGLNMNQPEYPPQTLAIWGGDDNVFADFCSVRPLFPMFHSPWQDLSRQQSMPDFDPKYDLPACYRMPATPSAQSKMTKFSDETLFYIFYAMPQDVLQDAAAYELTRRNWRYHKGIQMWLTKSQDSISRPGESFEQGEFIFWDVNMWQKTKQKFFLSYDMLEQRDTSLPYEEANPEAAKLERKSSLEPTRKASAGKQFGTMES